VFDESPKFRRRLEIARANFGGPKAALTPKSIAIDAPSRSSVSLVQFAGWTLNNRQHFSAPVEFEEIVNAVAPRGAQEEAIASQDALATKGRNTALCIVAALASMDKLDLSQPYKAAEVIEAMLATMGVSLGAEAIAGWLKDVPRAIESRRR